MAKYEPVEIGVIAPETKCYVYILRCGDGTLYTGWTKDVGRRLHMHNSGKGAKYTRGRLPVELVYQEEHESPSNALKRERDIKNMSKQQKLALISIRSGQG